MISFMNDECNESENAVKRKRDLAGLVWVARPFVCVAWTLVK